MTTGLHAPYDKTMRKIPQGSLYCPKDESILLTLSNTYTSFSGMVGSSENKAIRLCPEGRMVTVLDLYRIWMRF